MTGEGGGQTGSQAGSWAGGVMIAATKYGSQRIHIYGGYTHILTTILSVYFSLLFPVFNYCCNISSVKKEVE
jgi:hypothetical protein